MERSRSWAKSIVMLLALPAVVIIVLMNDIKSSLAWSAPILDGSLDDVYIQYGSITRYADANTHEATGIDNFAAAYLYVLEDENYSYVFYHQDKYYANDNSYGANSIHWETKKNGIRNFYDIWEDDKGELFSIGACSGDGD